MDIKKIDRNFIINTESDTELVYYSVTEKPFTVDGLAWFHTDPEFARIPKRLRGNLNKSLNALSQHTSGGCVRFKTNSKVLAISATVLDDSSMSHMTRVGSAGFDIYVGSGTEKSFIEMAVSGDQTDKIRFVCSNNAVLKEEGVKDITINFPLYNGLKELYVGLEKEASVDTPTPYSIKKPIVFYGSSITQGGCASRPGNSYTTMLSRWFDAPVYNFGFSGSAMGEPEVAELIASLDMCCFVMNYDHNPPNAEHLEKTHEPFFKTIRKAHPNIPIIILSRAVECDLPYAVRRREIIYNTYKNAVDTGDKNVYFINGKTIYTDDNRDACTVDGCHPNDLGFFRMAKAIEPIMKKALKNNYKESDL